MKTTLELPDPLFREAKATAARLSTTLRALITQALEEKLHPNPASPGSNQFSPELLIDLLRRSTAHPAHEFWPDDLTLRDPGRFYSDRFPSPKKITDCYLLALAVKRQGQLLTLDRQFKPDAVPGATAAHLAIL